VTASTAPLGPHHRHSTKSIDDDSTSDSSTESSPPTE